MARRFILLQLTDLHIGASWGGDDPIARLAETVERVAQLIERADGILISGDLADSGADGEYETAKRLLDPLRAPCYVLPGNHDDRGALRRQFDLPGGADAPINYSVALDPLRLVALDSTKPGHDRGELDEARLDWLDRELSAVPEQMTLLAMHHPPLQTGEPAWDRIGLPAGDREALAHVLDRHDQVRLVVGGHLHRTIIYRRAGRTVLAAPAVYRTSLPDLEDNGLELTASAPSFVLHVVTDGELSSHVLRAE